MRPNRANRIIVPERVIDFGMTSKFETDPYNVPLHDLLSDAEYTEVTTELNLRLMECRPKKVDKLLFYSGTALLPLIPWAIRRKKQAKKR